MLDQVQGRPTVAVASRRGPAGHVGWGAPAGHTTYTEHVVEAVDCSNNVYDVEVGQLPEQPQCAGRLATGELSARSHPVLTDLLNPYIEMMEPSRNESAIPGTREGQAAPLLTDSCQRS